MKTFDVFVKDRLSQMNVKPVRTFDVFIKDRLTQIDIVISTLVSREVFSFYDKIVIDCALRELEFLKEISMQTSMDINADLYRLYALVSTIAKSAMDLNIEVNFSQEDFISGTTKMEISSLPFYIINDLQTGLQSSQIIAFNLDMFDTGISLGRGKSELVLATDQVEMDKTSYLRPEYKIALLGNIYLSGKKVVDLNSINMELSVAKVGVFYLTLIEGGTSLYIGTAPISDVVLSKILYSSGFKSTIKLDVLDSLTSEAYISATSDIELFSSIISVINKILYPSNPDMQLSCRASIGLYRRRLLEEMDNIKLSDLDSNTLNELDYILLG